MGEFRCWKCGTFYSTKADRDNCKCVTERPQERPQPFTPEQLRQIELFKCRSVGETFTAADYDARALLLRLLAEREAQP